MASVKFSQPQFWHWAYWHLPDPLLIWVGALMAPESHRCWDGCFWLCHYSPWLCPPGIAKDAVTEAEGTAPELAGCQEYTGWACGVGYSCLLSLV